MQMRAEMLLKYSGGADTCQFIFLETPHQDEHQESHDTWLNDQI